MDDREHDRSHKNRKCRNQIDLKMSENQNIISFLVGSGFSIPAKLPSVPCLNKKISNLKASDLFITTDQNLLIIKKEPDQNSFIKREVKQFFEDFIRFYKEKVLESGDDFHYEKFYDYYSDQTSKLEKHSGIDVKLIEFYKSIQSYTLSKEQFELELLNKIGDFSLYFHQVLRNLLQLKNTDAQADPFRNKYVNFIKFLIKLKDQYQINIHTLNHDLLMEELILENNELSEHFSDGFDMNRSYLFGSKRNESDLQLSHKNDSNYCQLPLFKNIFSGQINLFKLHGSINYYKVGIQYPCDKFVFFKTEIPLSGVFRKAEDGIIKTGTQYLDPTIGYQPTPEFLSGYTYKMRRFGYGPDYNKVFFDF